MSSLNTGVVPLGGGGGGGEGGTIVIPYLAPRPEEGPGHELAEKQDGASLEDGLVNSYHRGRNSLTRGFM